MLATVVCLDLDRTTPTLKPTGVSRSGWQNWRNLLFVHYRYPTALVRELVPRELELDPYDGDMWVGIVPFEMEGVRLGWMPRAFGMDFLETNLRTYVHHKGEPGVFFFSLEAASRLAVEAARRGWGLPYHHATMVMKNEPDHVHYTTTRRANGRAAHNVRYRVGEMLGSSTPGTLEFFLLERYYLFALHKNRVHKGHVHHVPYPAQRAEVIEIEDGLIEAAGLPRAQGKPATVHYSKGVDVEVFGPWPV